MSALSAGGTARLRRSLECISQTYDRSTATFGPSAQRFRLAEVTVRGPEGVAATIHVVSGPFTGQTLTIQIADDLVELLESDDGQLRIDMLFEGLCRAVEAPDGLLRATDRGWSIASADLEV